MDRLDPGLGERGYGYTKVSLTPGADETELNFAWYSKDNGKAATPVVTSVRTGTNSRPLPARLPTWTPP